MSEQTTSRPNQGCHQQPDQARTYDVVTSGAVLHCAPMQQRPIISWPARTHHKLIWGSRRSKCFFFSLPIDFCSPNGMPWVPLPQLIWNPRWIWTFPYHSVRAVTPSSRSRESESWPKVFRPLWLIRLLTLKTLVFFELLQQTWSCSDTRHNSCGCTSISSLENKRCGWDRTAEKKKLHFFCL